MDDDLFEFEAPAEAAPELVLGKKKKKKKKKSLPALSKPQQEPPADDEPQPSSSSAVPTSAFASIELDSEEALDVVTNGETPMEEEEGLAAPTLSKKKKKKKKLPLVLEDPEQNSQKPQPPVVEESIPEPEPQPEPEVKRPLTTAEKKKAKKERERLAKLGKAKKEEDELNAILAELGDAPASAPSESADGNPSASQSAPMTAAQKKRLKKKKKAAAENDDAAEVDALLAELAAPDATPDPSGGNASGATGDVDDLLAELAGDGDAGTAKKKSRKKKKKGAAKADDDGAEGEAPATGAESKKPKKKESAAVRKMREQRERMLAEEERLRKLKEEEDARIDEEERKHQEAVAKKDEERAKKKAAERAKRERKRKEGTLLSKAEKERRKKADKFRQQMLEQGMVPAAVAGNSTQSDKPKRVVYDKKRRAPKAKPTDEVAEMPVEEAVVERSVPIPVEKEPEAESKIIPDAWDEVIEPEVVAEAEHAQNGEAKNSGQANGNQSEEDEEDSDDESESDDSAYEGMTKTQIAAEKRLDAMRRERGKQKAEARAARTVDNLRSPVICILGHVDTGKTKILDRIRRTNVQDGEAGGITQQIGATYFPIEAVKKEATKLEEGRQLDYNVPSLLIIDTPGHESFTNLRSRGSSLCDIAILVVDIMHGLEPQTRESIDLLKLRKTPFIVALNKIDRIYDWNAQPHNCPTRDSMARQPKHAREEFMRRVKATKLEFAEIGFNTELYWENDDVRKTVSIVPTSAISGEGVPDLLMLLLALPQKLLTDRLMFNPILEATVLEVKVIEGLGTSIDIILTGGTIREGDTLMVVGLDGPIVTTIRALLTPHPMKEMRVKGQFLHHKEIRAAQGIKISAEGLEKAVAGTQVMVVEDPNNEDELEYVREEVMKDFQTILTNVDKSGLGVYVQASTLGSLEALLEFLKTSKIPVSGINIGPVHKRDVTKTSTMLEKRKEFATILAFDVTVEREAKELAEETGVRIFTADIIYHLFDQFTAYMEQTKKQRREEVNDDVVFPSICKILPQHVYNKKDPIVVGVDVMEGILRVGTPLVVKHGEGWLDVGRVASIELNKKQVITARKGESVAVKIQHKSTEHIMYGRHFDFQDALISKMSRSAIEILKESFRDDLETEDWRLVVKLKKMFDVI